MNKRLHIAITFLVLLLINCAQVTEGLTGGSTLADAEPDTTVAAIASDYPRVDGSTSARPLQRWIACTILDVPCVWQEWMTDLENTERWIVPDPAYTSPPPFLPAALAQTRAERASGWIGRLRAMQIERRVASARSSPRA